MGFFDKLKDFAEDAGDAISKGAKNVTDNSKKMVEKTKLKNRISKMEEEINNYYAEIGKKYFELNSSNPGSEYAEVVQLIVDDQIKLSELNAELKAMDNKGVCPNCGAGVDENAKFCSECGSKFEQPVVVPEENTEAEVEVVAEAEVEIVSEDNANE